MRFSTKQALSTLGFLVAATVFCTAASLQGNAPPDQKKDASHKSAHTTRKDFYSNVAVLPPATVTDITENRLEYLFVDGGLNLGSLDLEPGYSIVPRGFSKERHDGCYGIHYCKQHLIVLTLDELPPGICGKRNSGLGR